MKCAAMAVVGPGKPLQEMFVDIEDPKGEALVIKIGGAGMCRTDIRLWEGREPRPGFRFPFVLGHENAGIIDEVGDKVVGLKRGDAVIVYSVWGDLTCKHCLEGKPMLCKNQRIPGQSYFFGGYAEYMHVPSYNYVQKVGGLDPVEAAPLADAGVTALSAVRKSLPFLYPGCAVIAYGIGGLASYGIQMLRALAPSAKIIASSRRKEKLEWATELGAHAVAFPSDLKRVTEAETRGVGAVAAIDFVGTEESTMGIASCLENGGVIIEVGMEGEKLSMPTFGTTAWQYQLIGSNYGTLDDLSETVQLVKRGGVKSHLIKRKLTEATEALKDLKEGSVMGRYVLVP